MPNISEIIEEFNIEFANFNKSVHPQVSASIKDYFIRILNSQKQSLISEILDHYKVCRTDEGFINYLNKLK
jgi:hypothetical protein